MPGFDKVACNVLLSPEGGTCGHWDIGLQDSSAESTKGRNNNWEKSQIAGASSLLTIDSDYILISLGAIGQAPRVA